MRSGLRSMTDAVAGVVVVVVVEAVDDLWFAAVVLRVGDTDRDGMESIKENEKRRLGGGDGKGDDDGDDDNNRDDNE